MLKNILNKILNKEKEIYSFWINNENKLVKYEGEKYWKLYNDYIWKNKDLFKNLKVIDYKIKTGSISQTCPNNPVPSSILEIKTETDNYFKKFDIPKIKNHFHF